MSDDGSVCEGGMDTEERKEIVTKLLRVDSCLICGEAAVFYDAEGDVIKRERSSIQYSYQQLFDCLCKCVELRKNCRLKKDWDFYKDPFPACGTCEQLLVSLAELYSKVEVAEEQLKSLIHSSEDKYLSCNWYEKHQDKYRSFRKQVLMKDFLTRQGESFRSTSLLHGKNYKSEPDIQITKCSADSPHYVQDAEEDDHFERVTVSPKAASPCDYLHSTASSHQPSKMGPVISQQLLSLEDTNKRRSLRKRPTPAYFSASSDDDSEYSEDNMVSLKYNQPPSPSTISDKTSSCRQDDKYSSSGEQFSEEECTSKHGTKVKRPLTSSSLTKPNPVSRSCLDRSNRALPKRKRSYVFKNGRRKTPKIISFSRCPVCDKPIRKDAIQEYKEHYWSHLNEEEKGAFYTDKDVLDLSTIPPMKRNIPYRKAAPFSERVQAGEVNQCPTCGKFVSKECMAEHLKIHLPPEKRQTFLCYLCGASLASQFSLENHLKRVHPDGKVKAAFKCLYPDCTSSYSSETDLKCHVEDTHSSSSKEKKERMCTECGRVLWDSQTLKTHGLVHSKERKHVCHHCSKSFPLKSTLRTHLAAIHGEGKKVLVCAQIGCGQQFHHRAGYSAHLRKGHGIYVGNAAKGKTDKTPVEKNNKFVCDVCGVVFKYNVSLKAHLSKVHPTGKEGAYICFYPTCTSNFFTELDLQSHVEQEHVANYDGDKHLCGSCGRVVCDSWALKQHQLVHTKERSHACHVCSKTFPLKATLVMHLEAVHGEGRKEFKCELEGCGAVYRTKVYLTGHMRKVHGIYVKGKRDSVKRMCTKL